MTRPSHRAAADSPAGEPGTLMWNDHMNTQFLIQLLVNGLVVGTLYGVVAMSFVLIYKATQVVNFAQVNCCWSAPGCAGRC